MDVRRRDMIALIAGGIAAWPSATRAQNSSSATIGYLSSKDERAEAGIIAGVRKGLAEQGLIEGQNVSIEYRFSAG